MSIKNIKELYDLIEEDIDEFTEKYIFEDYYGLVIEINRDTNDFNIYMEFIHPLYDTQEYEYECDVIVYYAKTFEQVLQKLFLEKPQQSSMNYLGAPFDDQCLGYYNMNFDCKLIKIFIKGYIMSGIL